MILFWPLSYIQKLVINLQQRDIKGKLASRAKESEIGGSIPREQLCVLMFHELASKLYK
jgi:hypothetical protein